MSKVKQKIKVEADNPKVSRPKTSNLSLEERLKVISNLIVDRILEDQLNGNLHFKTKQGTK